ncbi:MAG: hypothetical protein KDD94_05530, partial [Calditrichaeota bacterium]|nr:hypothetical protein [Calditrichota bacterium]
TYPEITDQELLSGAVNTSVLKDALVVIYYGHEEFVTTAGVRNRAEITADVLNQLINRLAKNQE